MYKRIKNIQNKPLRLIAAFLFFFAIALIVKLILIYAENEAVDNWLWIDSIAYALIYWVVNFYNGELGD